MASPSLQSSPFELVISALIYTRLRTCFDTLARIVSSGSVVGTTDIGRYFNGMSMTEKWLIETARKDFEKLGEYGNIMIHSICELSEDLYNQLTSDL